MFVIVSSYRAKVGEEDAIIALHEDWQRSQGLKSEGYIFPGNSSERSSPPASSSQSRASRARRWRRQQNELERDAWHDRLVSLIEEGPVHTGCTSEWMLRKRCGIALEGWP